MNRIFLATHGHMASGVRSSLNLLIGKTEHITVFDAYVDERNLDEAVQQFYSQCTGDDIALLITDLYGGSVNNQLTAYAGHRNTFLISGFNLAFMLELCICPDINITKERLLALVEESRALFRVIDLEALPIADADLFDEQEVLNDNDSTIR